MSTDTIRRVAAELAQLLDLNSEPLVTLDRCGRILAANGVAADLLGLSLDQLTGRPLIEPGRVEGDVAALQAGLESGGRACLAVEVVAGGNRILVDVHLNTLVAGCWVAALCERGVAVRRPSAAFTLERVARLADDLGHERLSRLVVSPPDPSPAEALPRGSEVVLLAEDDPSVRDMVVRLLSGLGYRVIARRTAEDALAAAAEVDGVDLLLTDIVMPGMSGLKLAAALREGRPDLPVVFMSGFAEGAAARDGDPVAGSAFLAKPFRVRDLAVAVRAGLDRSRA